MKRVVRDVRPFALIAFALLTLRACGPLEPAFAASAAPTETQRLDAFAHEYNGYVHQLGRGVVDLKAWQRVQHAWRSL